MIDEGLYRETFSRLRASQEAKEEVLHRMETKKHARRLPKVLRSAAIAAAVVMALAVTAGAVNLATDGQLFRQFLITWVGDDSMMAVDDAGNQVYITTYDGEDLVTMEDGRLILHADQDIDITDEISDQGSYHYEYEDVTVWGDGTETTQTITIDVTGDLESWTATRSDGSGVSYTTVTGGSESGDRNTTQAVRPSQIITGQED